MMKAPGDPAGRAARPRRWLLFGVAPPADAHDELQRVRFLRDLTSRCLLVTVVVGTVFALVALAEDLAVFAVLVGFFVVLGVVQTVSLTRRLHRLERPEP